jgi:CheY-like chemotaxis protein
VRQLRAEQGHLDWIFCDSRLPDVDGIELARELTQAAPEAGVVLLLDSTQLGADLERVKAIERASFLVKPLKRQEIRELLVRKPGSEAAPADLPALPAGTRAHARLLLVEDNPDNRLLIRTYLKKEPYDVDEAENGAIAVACFGEGRYDLILMDVQMPVMDGHEATRAIRDFERSNGRPPVPIIALTAHAVKEDMEKSLAAGCTAHLTKPIKKQVLLAALAEHLDAHMGEAASS